MIISREEIFNICRHELGHWYLAKHCDFDQQSIEIHIRGNGLYGSSLSFPEPDLPTKNSILNFLNKRISVLIAGVVSEIHKKEFSPEQKQKLYETTAKHDIEHTQILMHIARGIKFSGKISKETKEKQLGIIYNDCWNNVESVIDKYFTEICFVAEKMTNKMQQKNSLYYKFEKSELVKYINEFRKS